MLLDFEKPIVALEEKLARMQEMANQHEAPKLTRAIAKLAKDIQTLRQRTFQNLTRWQRVQLARHPDRPYTLDYIQRIAEDFVELHGDRYAGEDPALVAGFGTVEGRSMLLLGHQKGRTTKERQRRNFGMPHPEGYRKSLRLMHLAEKFQKPVVAFIDTPGAYPGMGAEERGQAEAIARNIQEMFGLRVPIVCIVIGEGASGGALAIGVGDRILMLENTWYSVIAPESCSAILWKSWEYKEQAAEILRLTAQDMAQFGFVDGLVPEPLGGAHRDWAEAAALVKREIVQSLKELDAKPIEELLQLRTEKFCTTGTLTFA